KIIYKLNFNIMRQILFFFIAFAFTATTFAQHGYVKIKHPKANESVVTSKVDRIDPRVEPLDFAPNTSIVNAVSRKNANGLEEAVVMITQYDLQTNSSLGNRLYAWPDGSVAATATWGVANAPSFPDRGTGYAFNNGTSWSPMPTARLESVRSGWPSITALGTEGEALVSHDFPSGVNLYTRAAKGTGSWIAKGQITNPPGRNISWPRLASSGENNSVLHAVGAWQNSANTIENEVFYNRSFDGGTTWDGWTFPPEVDLTFYTNSISADDYVIATNGDNVAILFTSAWFDLFFIKSTDNGDTWEKTVVWEHPYPMFDWNTTLTTDTLWAPDNSANIAIDNDGMVHVVWATTRVTHDAPGTTYSYFPVTDGIGYWNEAMGQIPTNPENPHKTLDPEYLDGLNMGMVVGWMPDINGDGQVTFAGDYLSYRSLGVSTHPTIAIDENGSIMIAYSTWDETRVSEGKNLRSVFASYKDGFFGTWYLVDENLTPGIFHEEGESYSVVAAQRGYNGAFYVMYSEDATIGLALDDDHGYQDNLIYVSKVTPVVISVNETINPVNSISAAYPNPTADKINFTVNLSQASKNVEVSVHNIAGQLVSNETRSLGTGVNTVSIDAANLRSGLYFCTISVNGYKETKKVIVQ
ncbi:MAG: T9SS type A sorting domain-containing protein, partial [Bacteroidetes bacterium]|nr:T9SS type A sorting domain-containing protein [Bacteroidota bacterium]